MVSIPKKALARSKLTLGDRVGDGSHKVWHAKYIEDGALKEGFFKELEPERNFPELLANGSVATSTILKLSQERTAEEHLVCGEEGQVLGIFSLKLEGFKPFNIKGEPIPSDSIEREQVIPSTETLVRENTIEIIMARQVFGDNDPHPHNLSLKGGIDYDMFWYEEFSNFIKRPRTCIELPKKRVDFSVRDYERYPCCVDAKPYHSPTYAHPGQGSITIPVPEMVQTTVLPSALPKVYADSEQFANLAADPNAQAQKVAAALKILLTFQPEVLCKRLFDEFESLDENEYQRIIEQHGSLINWAEHSDENESPKTKTSSKERAILTTRPLDYTSLGQTIRAECEQAFPQLYNEQTNRKAFINFMMKVFQARYDSFYRTAVFYMGCEDNGFGVPLLPTHEELFRKPSIYKNIQEWMEKQNESIIDPACKYNLEELHQRYHQVWRDAYAPRLRALLRDARNLTKSLAKLVAEKDDVVIVETSDALEVTDSELTDVWQLFGTLKNIAVGVKKDSDKDNTPNSNGASLNTAFKLLAHFTNELQNIITQYYGKKGDVLLEADNQEFTQNILKLCSEYSDKINDALAHTTSYAKDKFAPIINQLEQFALQARFSKHLRATDEEMLTVPTSIKREILPLTHEEVIEEFNEKLFAWVDTLSPDTFKLYMHEIIDSKYSTTFEFTRKRAKPTKDYLEKSTESNHNKLAYILSSGKSDDGALNKCIIRELTPLMLQKNYIASVSTALRTGSFESNIDVFTQAAISCAKHSRSFVHLHNMEGVSLIYNTVYEWVENLSKSNRERLRLIKNAALGKYENGLSKVNALFFWSTPSRKDEINGYFRKYDAPTALAMTFMKGTLTSTASSQLFLDIIQQIQDDIKKNAELKKDPGYALIGLFNEAEHKDFYLQYLQGKHTLVRTPTEKRVNAVTM
ncbi:hypothetical protein J2N86_13460 [Legionella lytica]|uniref:Uncharacterized protein n=1 Tax=Legionella lytica TaxID=96232 RepID=A0ABY4Y7P8_9GAMM|nr:hypothetical protein [Legionella lytica]USQ13665.1 hypothetical protein J2N86_13460 [Legionella lytica]